MDSQFKTLAVVGGKAITDQDVNQMLTSLGQRGAQYNNPQGKKVILEQLVNKELVLMDAKKNLMEHDAEFKAELEKLKNELLANFYVDRHLRQIQVKEEEIRGYFDANPDEFAGEETVSAAHILVETEEKANAILAEIRSGAVTFAEAAKAHSSCPSAQSGGDLGEFGHGQMVREFDEACFTMNVGDVAGPVKTQFGYHLIQLNAKNEKKPLAYEDVREELGRRLLADNQQKAYQSKMNQLRILYPVDYSGIL